MKVPLILQITFRFSTCLAIAYACRQLNCMAADAAIRPRLAATELAPSIDALVHSTPFERYKFYILSIPLTAEDFTVTTASTSQPYYPKAYSVPAGIGITFVETPYIKPNGKKYFSGTLGDRKSRFVKVEYLDVPLPVAAAKGISDAFLCGLMTRLFLDDYSKASGFELPIADVRIIPDDLPGLANSQNDLLSKFQKPETYGYRPKKATGGGPGKNKPIEEKLADPDKFDDFLGQHLRRVNMQPIGMLLGWKCATEILDESSEEREKLKKAVYTLAKNRLSPRELGVCIAYTISYLEGWSLVTTLSKENRDAEDSQFVLEEIAAQSDKSRISDWVFKLFLADYAAMIAVFSQDSGASGGDISQFRDLVEGFQQGTVSASAQLFESAYNLGFEKGYQRGFKEGFTAGYSAGFNDGFSRGYAKAAIKFQKAISDSKTNKGDPMGRFISGAETVGELAGFDVKKAKSVVKNVVSVFARIF